ncbi:hypothetical protein [Roseicyclus amphidinii]|uniref:hypothetical protein n=1 Tax=Roseicyclus amphidinii TaxID=3034232 RepID=UPI0024E1484F|nr:hypothetical protein [Roseicyclus sp. Amp-Y-6]
MLAAAELPLLLLATTDPSLAAAEVPVAVTEPSLAAAAPPPLEAATDPSLAAAAPPPPVAVTDPALADAAAPLPPLPPPETAVTEPLLADALAGPATTGLTIRAPGGAAAKTAASSDGTHAGTAAIAASGVQMYWPYCCQHSISSCWGVTHAARGKLAIRAAATPFVLYARSDIAGLQVFLTN